MNTSAFKLRFTLGFKLKLLLACISGGLLTFAYAPFSFWLVLFVCLPTCIYLLTTVEQKQRFKLGFSFGLGWFGAGISWVHVSIADFGGLPLIASLGLMLLLSGYLALFPAFAFYLTGRYFKPHLWTLVLPFIWLVIEWLRSWLFTGFPWLSLGYSQLHSPLGGWIPAVGEFGLSAIVILLCTSVTMSIVTKKWSTSIIVIAVFLFGGLILNQYQWAKPTGQVVHIAMVQGNIQQDMRWTPDQDQPTMDKYRNMTADHWLENDVIIWPEAAIPQLEPIALDYLRELDAVAAASRTGLITGIVNYNFETRQAYNNLIGLGLKQAPLHSTKEITNATDTDLTGHYRYFHGNRFAKHHLLPIGEFIPLENWIRGIAPIFDLPMSSFSRGAYQQNNIQANGFNFAPAICFEIAFPRQIASNLYYNTDFIITVSNDAWFGKSHGPAQHLEIAQVRAKEFGLPVLRATNNGITAFVDHTGKVQSRLPQFEAAVLSDSMQLVEGQTPYRIFGNLPSWLFFSALFIFGLKQKFSNPIIPK
jgi:apolipoprotein N-acyltransferase